MDITDPSLNLRYDYYPSRTSSLDFLRALDAFLSRNRVDFIGSFRIRLEPTPNKNWTLLVVGETSKSDLEVSGQVVWGATGPSLLSSPNEASIVSSSSGPIFSEGDMHVDNSNYPENDFTQMPCSQLSKNFNNSHTIFDSIYPLSSYFHSSSLSNISSGTSFLGTDESHSLATLFDNTNPIVVDTQRSPATAFDVAHVHDSLRANYNPCTSPVLDFGSEIDTTPPMAPAQTDIGNLAHRHGPSACRKSEPQHKAFKRDNRKRKSDLSSSDDATEVMIKSLSQNILCEDYYSLLESELPRWTTEGLWYETPQKPVEPKSSATTTNSSYSKLERVYHAVCQLSSRMSDDVVRNRMALIQLHLEYTETHKERRHTSASTCNVSTVGRGDASNVIDYILENIHEGWETLDQRRRTELRAKFHDRKKCGKRWSQLANALGPGILLTCSTKLANAVRSTTVTAKILEAVIERVKLLDPATVKIIAVVSPLAACLLKDDGFNQFEDVKILRQLRCCSRRTSLMSNKVRAGAQGHDDTSIRVHRIHPVEPCTQNSSR
ncbi:hypothetical protein HD806DRAFT_485896 [Xylariaceae sp. AK1471]|nr:hypothetical protein HD806DRAFT_485896 [Xylariaceae sp. AK1471]